MRDLGHRHLERFPSSREMDIVTFGNGDRQQFLGSEHGDGRAGQQAVVKLRYHRLPRA